MTRYRIFPYTQGSEGAIALRDALQSAGEDAVLLFRADSSYVFREGDCLINWGSGHHLPVLDNALNSNITAALNKLKFFERLVNLDITPRYTTYRTVASQFTFPVFCRTSVEGRDGAGIHVAETEDNLIDARLYVEGVPKTNEYRVHAGRMPNGRCVIIGGSNKIHRTVEGLNPNIWAGDGALFGSFITHFPAAVKQVVLRAMLSLAEFTFLGFDVAYDSRTDRAWVLEANSAPMMTPFTARAYAKFFREFVAERNESNPVEASTVIEAYEPTEHEIGEVFDDLNCERITLKAIIRDHLRYVQSLNRVASPDEGERE